MARRATKTPDFPLTPFLPTLVAPAGSDADGSPQGRLADAFPDYGRENFERAMAASGLSCPPVDSALIDHYLGYFEDIGFLDAASRSAAP